ncbi:hypothetical protein, partial [Streptomyces europaeiscabiei]|uniref:hypothetical protein n=1 Tax=Streptomyces europaeiscabiei TaxID=146819 RepID=UPI001C1E3236
DEYTRQAGGGGVAEVPGFWPAVRRKSEKRGCSPRRGAVPPSTTEPRGGVSSAAASPEPRAGLCPAA